MYRISSSTKYLLSGILVMLVTACAPSTQLTQEPEANDLLKEGVNKASAETAVVATIQDIADKPAVDKPAIDKPAVDSQVLVTQVSQSNSPSRNGTLISSVANKAALSFESSTQSCPDQFYNVKLPTNGKFCQVFAADLPASMILFVPQDPAKVIEFYQQDSATFSASRAVKDRFIMNSNDNNATVIFSRDGQGTQVDILVKNI